MTSDRSWLESLRPLLSPSGPERPRLAVVGIGQSLRGDDGLGPAFISALRHRLKADDRLLLLDGGAAPENATGRLRRFRPDLVLLIDAAQLDAPPGAIAILDWRAADGLSAATHALPPSLLAAYLTAELGCLVLLLGIQPAQTNFGRPLSTAVRTSLRRGATAIAALLAEAS
jgi:hydrogenase 3 maturation protease